MTKRKEPEDIFPPPGYDDNRDIDLRELGWKSASQLKRENPELYVSYAHIGDLFQKLEYDLVQDLIAANFTEENAKALVSKHLIGWREIKGQGVFMASPEALRTIEDDLINKKARPVPDELAKYLLDTQAQLLAEISKYGYTEDKALKLIQTYLGQRHGKSGPGTPAR